MKLVMQKVKLFTNLCLYFLLLVFGHAFGANKVLCEKSYDKFLDRALAVWTQLDLIRATNANNDYKQKVSAELMDKVLALYCYTSRSMLNLDIDQKKDVIELLTQIEEAFSEVFEDIKLPEATTSCTILNRMRYTLKEPASIKAKGPT